MLVGLLAAAASVVPVYALGMLVDQVRAGAGVRAIVPITVVIVAAALVGGLAAGLSSLLVSRLGERILAGLRERTVSVRPAPAGHRAGPGRPGRPALPGRRRRRRGRHGRERGAARA